MIADNQAALTMTTTSQSHHIVHEIENLIVSLLSEFVLKGTSKISLINGNNWSNCQMAENKILSRRPNTNDEHNKLIVRDINYKNINSKHRFALFMYIMAEAHKNILRGEKSTIRELYYKNIPLTISQNHLNMALLDVCYKFEQPSWGLRIMSSGKGLVAGALTFVMVNGAQMDCSSTTAPTLIPTDFDNVDLLETTALFVLLVEKDTVFEKLVNDEFFQSINDKVILVTGKGFPDLATRILINRLHNECLLPVYTLVDADPFGIEILIVYRHGSRSMAHAAQQLTCPQICWIGVHPSEIALMKMQTEPLGRRDKQKICELLSRNYLDISYRRELQIMQHLQQKAEVENLSAFTLSFLLKDYIPNKIKRKLLL